MTQFLVPSHLPDRPVKHIQFAKDWWHDDEARLLPGEEHGHTVFVIDYYDGCKYFGYTKEQVFYRAVSLTTQYGGWGTNPFVEQHAQRVPYVIRCIKSNLDDHEARELRDLLVAQAPQNVQHGRGKTIPSNCSGLRGSE